MGVWSSFPLSILSLLLYEGTLGKLGSNRAIDAIDLWEEDICAYCQPGEKGPFVNHLIIESINYSERSRYWSIILEDGSGRPFR